MSRHPGRGGSAWETVRRQVVSESTVCSICGGPLEPDAPAGSRWETTVDHVIALATTRDLEPDEQRRLALDPALLRPAHRGCNSARSARGNRSRRLGGDVHVSREAGAW
jgi:5-methylcytosine-specific restriction endonuclease McrA